jgi:hypothetical protein
MLVIMKKTAKTDDLIKIKDFLIRKDYDIHQSTGANRTIIGIIGDTEQLDAKELEEMPGVLQVVRIAKEE